MYSCLFEILFKNAPVKVYYKCSVITLLWCSLHFALRPFSRTMHW